MQIRNKLLLATAIPIALLVVQVLLVNVFIRELQQAVQFIGTAQNVIEADLQAKDLISELRTHVRSVPQSYVQPVESPNQIDPLWREITHNISAINSSSVVPSLSKNVLNSVHRAFEKASTEIIDMNTTLAINSPDMNTLLVHAISTNTALDELDQALADLAVELRQQLQLAVDREREIHDRPLIAGGVIGGLAVLLLMFFVWLFVDRGIIRRLTKLSGSMLAIAGGDLKTQVPLINSSDEIGKMGQALTVFRENAIEVRESNRREVVQKRKQRQFWLEHMASFLRHEVKNKQVGAEQSIRILSRKKGDDPLVIKYCDRATSSLIEMKELINSTVNAADIETALLSESFLIIEAQKFLDQYIVNANDQIDSDIDYINEAKEACFFRGDKLRLEQMLDKLVSNAIDFKSSGTSVVIRLTRPDSEHIAIGIENEGPALHEDTQALFGLSYSVRSPENRQLSNVGFGLFIARRIAEYHHGTIEADNTGSGVVFAVVLPTLSPGIVVSDDQA